MKCKYNINQYFLCPNSQRQKDNIWLLEHPCKYATNNIIGEIDCNKNKKENENENRNSISN